MHLPVAWRLAVCALAIGVVAPTTGALGASAPSHVKISNCGAALTRPKTVTLTCADAGIVLTKLKWSSFGGATAKASGKIDVNTCEPDCAAGAAKSYRVKVSASRPRSCKHGLAVYGRVAVTFTAAKPRNASQLSRYTLACPS